MKEHVPTSVILEKLLEAAPKDYVTLAWLLDSLRERSFGIIMLLMALVGIVPGASVFIGGLLVVPATQMILARRNPVFPRFLSSRRLSTPQVARLFRRAVPVLRWAEKFIHPRWRTPISATKRAVGLIVLLLAATLVGPIPFSHIIPIFAIVLISFAYLEEDGVLLCIALLIALVSLTITLATIWGTVAGADLLETL